MVLWPWFYNAWHFDGGEFRCNDKFFLKHTVRKKNSNIKCTQESIHLFCVHLSKPASTVKIKQVLFMVWLYHRSGTITLAYQHGLTNADHWTNIICIHIHNMHPHVYILTVCWTPHINTAKTGSFDLMKRFLWCLALNRLTFGLWLAFSFCPRPGISHNLSYVKIYVHV